MPGFEPYFNYNEYAYGELSDGAWVYELSPLSAWQKLIRFTRRRCMWLRRAWRQVLQRS